MAEIIKVDFNKFNRQFHKDIEARVDEMLASSAKHIHMENTVVGTDDAYTLAIMVELFASLAAANIIARGLPRSFASWAELTKAGQRLGLEHSKRIAQEHKE